MRCKCKYFRDAAMAACLLVCSCSIKEDRTPCPCYLVLDLDPLIEAGDYRESLVSVSSDMLISQEKIELAPYEDIGYEVKVPRRTIRMSVAAGVQSASWHGDTLRCEENAEADALYAWSHAQVCDDDMVYLSPKLHKQYCLVGFNILGYDDGEYEYALRLRADCNALRLYDLKPVEGNYSATVRLSNSGSYSVRVPRQADNRLRLDILMPDRRGVYGDDDLVSTFDIGAEMAALGYDWTKEDLDDVVVTVDMVQANISVEIHEWNRSDIVVEL